MQVYIGYSLVRTADQIIKWLDIDPNHPEGISVFERMFGCGYIRPGDFEVYGKEDMDQRISVAEIKKCFPFDTGDLGLWQAELDAAQCVFWIKSESQWQRTDAEGVIVTDRVNVNRFVFEDDAAQ